MWPCFEIFKNEKRERESKSFDTAQSASVGSMRPSVQFLDTGRKEGKREIWADTWTEKGCLMEIQTTRRGLLLGSQKEGYLEVGTIGAVVTGLLTQV